MAFTSFRTYVSGEIITAAILNVDHRDNGRYWHGDDGTAQVNSGWEVIGTAAYLMVTGITTTQRDALTGSAGMIVSIDGTGFQGRHGTNWRDLLPYVGGGVSGDVFYHDGTITQRLAAGTAGWVLTTQGTASAPTWTAATTAGYFGAATAVLVSADTERSTLGTATGKIKTIRTGAGTFSIAVDLKYIVAGTGVQTVGEFRRNGTLLVQHLEAGTTYATYTSTLGTWKMEDTCELWFFAQGGGTAFARNFRLRGTAADANQLVTD